MQKGKNENGRIRGKIAFCCKALEVSRQGFYNYLKYRDKSWKYEALAAMMIEIREEDEYNDTYGRERNRSFRRTYSVRNHGKTGNIAPSAEPPGLTKADKEAQKYDDLLKRNFTADEPNKKCVTDITELKANNGKLYLSAIFDCFDLLACGLAMDTNMKAVLCTETV